MLDRDQGGLFRWRRDARPLESRKPLRVAHRPGVEGLEGRQLLAASIASIPDVTVPAQVGYQVPVNGSASGATQQTFTVSSSNPDVKASVARGQFVTVNVTHAAATPSDTSFSGSFTYQLFQDLTPNTATRIQSFTNGALAGVSGNYNGTQFFRVVKGFSNTGGPLDTVIQGGPQGASGNGKGPVELNPQLAFVQPGAVAIANAGPNTEGQEFFVTTGPQPFLNFGYTIFGEVVSGQNVVAQIGNVATQPNGSGENSSPVTPVNITTATTSPTDPNGVIHLDATGAKQGETSTITVSATDPATRTTASRTFHVTVGAKTNIPNTATFAPTAQAPTPVTQTVRANQTATFSTPFQANNPSNNPSVVTAYSLVSPPAHGTVAFNTTKQTAVYTPAKDFKGTDSFSYKVTSTNSTSGANPATASSATESATVNVATAGPVSQPISQPVLKNTPTTVTLKFTAPSASVTTTAAIVTPPRHGTLSAINNATNTVVYTPNPGFTGIDGFTYQATDSVSTTTPPTMIPGNTATVSLGVGTNTGAVRQIGNVLVVTPLPRTDQGVNQVVVSQQVNPANPAVGDILVTVNGALDAIQSQVLSNDPTGGIGRVIVYGSKASDHITVQPGVGKTIPVTLDGGHGGKNVLQAGSGSTREHGWFGQNTLIGGTGPNQLIGRAGHVKFKPTATTNEIFAGKGHPGTRYHRSSHGGDASGSQATGGTFYKYVNGHTVPTTAPTTGDTGAAPGIGKAGHVAARKA